MSIYIYIYIYICIHIYIYIYIYIFMVAPDIQSPIDEQAAEQRRRPAGTRLIDTTGSSIDITTIAYYYANSTKTCYLYYSYQ